MDGKPDNSCISGVHKQSSRSNTIIFGRNDDSGGRQQGAHDDDDDDDDDDVSAAAVLVLVLDARISGPLVPLPIVDVEGYYW